MSPVGFFCRSWLPCGKCCHLIILRFDTALIDNVGRTCVVGGVFQAPQAPGRRCRGVLVACFWWWPGPLPGSPAQQGRPFLLPISFSFGSISISLSCMLVLQVSWSFNPYLELVLHLDVVLVHSWAPYLGSVAPTPTVLGSQLSSAQ